MESSLLWCISYTFKIVYMCFFCKSDQNRSLFHFLTESSRGWVLFSDCYLLASQCYVNKVFRNRKTNTVCVSIYTGFPGSWVSNESACNSGDVDSIPGSGRSPGEGNGNLLQYSCLRNPTDRRAWWAPVHGAPKSWTQLSN